MRARRQSGTADGCMELDSILMLNGSPSASIVQCMTIFPASVGFVWSDLVQHSFTFGSCERTYWATAGGSNSGSDLAAFAVSVAAVGCSSP